MRKLILVLAALGLCLIKTDVYAQGIDEYTKLLLHFNDADGSINFVDSSSGNHPVTTNGNAQIDTSQSKFGGASGFFDGNGDYLSLADSADWNFGAGDFTLDFWVRFNALASYHSLYSQYANASNFIELIQYVSVQKLQFRVSESASSLLTFECAWNPSTATWYHIALVRSGNTWYIFIDGVSQTLNLDSGSYSATLPDIAGSLYIGTFDTTQYFFDGWLDEFRVSKGIARWTANFTPPIAEYGSIPNTSPLAHAGVDAEAYVNEEVILNASQSYDPDGQIVSWVWRSLSDPQKPVVAEGETTTMNAHGYAEELIELTVTDNRGGTGTDTMKITNPGTQGPAGPQGPQGSPGITPEEIAAIQGQINTLQQENTVLQQQNVDQQRKLEEDRYLLEQLPQLQKKIAELEGQ